MSDVLIPFQNQKLNLVDEIVQRLSQELSQSIQAANEAHEGATHEQSKAETQYDTLALEHAYLAEGQSRRVASLKQEIQALQAMSIQELSNDDEIILGALIAASKGHLQKLFFLCPGGGGQQIIIDGNTIQVVTPTSPLGAELLGLAIGDSFLWPDNTDGTITSIA